MFLQNNGQSKVAQVFICAVAWYQRLFMVYRSEIDCLDLKHFSIIQAKLVAAQLIRNLFN